MDKQGLLVVIEGLDGSGKTTQTELLADSLKKKGRSIRRVKFPDYASKSSALVNMYLAGEIGGLGEVNPYAASSFYACDRYISYQRDWKNDYQNGGIILCDRYTTSNLAYQMSKLPETEWDSFMDWLWDYEFTRMRLPEPNLVLYLDMHPDTSRTLLHKRYEGDASKMDLHEQNLSYLLTCREAALYAAEKLGWPILRVCDGKMPLPVEAVSEMIERAVGRIADSER